MAYYSVRLFCFPTADKQLLCQRKQNSPELFIDFASLPIPFLFLSLYVQRQTFFKLAQIVYHVRRGVFFCANIIHTTFFVWGSAEVTLAIIRDLVFFIKTAGKKSVTIPG